MKDIRNFLSPFPFLLSCLSFGLSIGFAKFYDRFVYLPNYSVSLPPSIVYFPFFPNVLDSMVLVVIAAYLMFIALQKSVNNGTSCSKWFRD